LGKQWCWGWKNEALHAGLLKIECASLKTLSTNTADPSADKHKPSPSAVVGKAAAAGAARSALSRM